MGRLISYSGIVLMVTLGVILFHAPDVLHYFSFDGPHFFDGGNRPEIRARREKLERRDRVVRLTREELQAVALKVCKEQINFEDGVDQYQLVMDHYDPGLLDCYRAYFPGQSDREICANSLLNSIRIVSLRHYSKKSASLLYQRFEGERDGYLCSLVTSPSHRVVSKWLR